MNARIDKFSSIPPGIETFLEFNQSRLCLTGMSNADRFTLVLKKSFVIGTGDIAALARRGRLHIETRLLYVSRGEA